MIMTISAVKNPSKRYIVNGCFIVILFFLAILQDELALAIYAIAVNLFMILRIKKNQYLLFFYLLLFFFSLNFIYPMFFDSNGIIYINQLYSTEIKYKTLFAYVLFILTNFIFIKPIEKTVQWKYKRNDFGYILFVAIHLLALIFGINRSDNNESYVVRINTLYELIYFFIFFEIIFSGGNRKKLALTLSLAAVSILQDLFYDGRITSLQIILLLFILFYKKIKLRYLVPVGIICLLVFLYVGQDRIGAQHKIDLIGNLLKIDTFYFAFQASETHIYVGDFIDWNTKFSSFIGNFLNVFFIDNGAVYNVSAITHEFVNHYYGGYIFTWFYFWGGYTGACISGLIITFIINHNMRRRKDLNMYMLILCFATLPRWYIYEPTILFKYAILSVTLVYFFFIVFSKKRRDVLYEKKLNKNQIAQNTTNRQPF